MALKDWKRISNFSYLGRWENKKTFENLIMVKSSIPQNNWIVYSWKVSKRGFKSKKEAIKFAKRYMKKH